VVSPSKKFFSDFSAIWYVDKRRLLMHDGMPYDLIQGQGQGHECLKATQQVSRMGLTIFYLI